MSQLSFLIVDDHDVVRRGLKQIIEEEFPGARFGEAANADSALELAKSRSWSIIILDINMPGKSGLDVMKELKVLCPKTPVLVLSVQPEDQYAMPVLKAGASGYLSKDAVSADLVDALKKVLAGGTHLSQAVIKKITDPVQKKEKAPHEKLSFRELQVLRLLAAGKTPGEVAKELDLSAQAVSTYRSRILRKFKLRTTSELIRYAVKMGW